jgi:peptidyl-prolyl cis-trans isomerase A (cyclophilin A)
MKQILVTLLTAFSLSSAAFSAPDHFSFSFSTTQGKISFECPAGWGPIGEKRLYELVTTGFFTNVAFFRVIKGFVAQFGISGDPAIAAKWEKANLADDPVVASNVAGTLTYANAGPNTRTTQLFINLVDNARLDKMGFTPICKIADAKGLEVAKKLYAEYAESPDQDLITKQGNAYLKTNFPKLDYIQSAELE